MEMFIHKIVLILLVLLINKYVVLSERYNTENLQIFDHGTIETYSSDYVTNTDNNFSKSDLVSVSLPPPKNFRSKIQKLPSIMKPSSTTYKDYNTRPTFSTEEKINFMKTYFDPVTKQPFR